MWSACSRHPGRGQSRTARSHGRTARFPTGRLGGIVEGLQRRLEQDDLDLVVIGASGSSRVRSALVVEAQSAHPANVFVLGLDELNRQVLERLPGSERLTFHPLLTIRELQHGATIPFAALLAEAERRLRAFDGTVDAIVGFWDFPVSSMVPLLCRRFGLRAAPLEAVLRCEHKYWSRLEQAKVIDAYPRFELVDLDDPDVAPPDGLRYPFWLKPVKAFSSEHAHRVADIHDFRRAAADIRTGIGRVGEPFDWVLRQANLPDAIARVGGIACLAEEEASGAQVTIEGYAVDGEVTVSGAFDTLRFDHIPSFRRYRYPSRLPRGVLERMAELCRVVIKAIGLEPSTFNVELFWDSDTDDLKVLEVNPRHSQSHAKLTEAVDGVANHKTMLDLALGRAPHVPQRQGQHRTAAKWFLKRFEDGMVTRSPTAEEVRAIEAEVPGATIDLVACTGDRLSELHDQDSYSYTLANIYTAADDDLGLVETYERCVELLRFEVSPP